MLLLLLLLLLLWLFLRCLQYVCCYIASVLSQHCEHTHIQGDMPSHGLCSFWLEHLWPRLALETLSLRCPVFAESCRVISGQIARMMRLVAFAAAAAVAAGAPAPPTVTTIAKAEVDKCENAEPDTICNGQLEKEQ
ncbi:unnamed protein product [Polarella glacialis]|uniref:Secreted protein n=1 Tax=Polarella glacialis TaxID=89957 RepID=A0A813L171_POLGL|nr:unnamed protein product [Polarella glacialis]CAE8715460.1 unnamed protein product [Polarella glacialis]